MMDALRTIGTFWLGLFIAYGIIAVVLIVIRASLSVIGRMRAKKPKPD